MRDPEIIETELMEISAIADDSVKLERIIALVRIVPRRSPFRLASAHGPTRQASVATLKLNGRSGRAPNAGFRRHRLRAQATTGSNCASR
jgi:hypothetical protein